MENEATKNRPLKVAFLLDATSLRSLQALLSEIIGPIEYRVKFSDGSTIKYGDVEEIIAQPNAGTKCIVGVISSVEGEGRSIFLGMRGDPEPSVEYTVAGMQSDVFNLADSLDNWIASCTRWYSPFHASNLGLLLAAFFLALPFYVTGHFNHAYPPNENEWQPYGSIAVLIAVFATEFWTLKLFPRATFAVGYGAQREKLFNVIRISVLLALAVALFKEWLVRHL
jgi:hypothetical protein